MSDESVGRLIPPQQWRDALPDDVFTGLVQWAGGQDFDVRLLGWNTDGQSESYVASVALERTEGSTSGAILKILPPDLAQRESRAVGIAENAGPREFVDAHLTRTISASPLPGNSGRWVHLQDVAHAGTEQLRSMSTLTDDPRFGRYCGVILASLAREWNASDSRHGHTDVSPSDFIQRDLASRQSELRAFATAQGWDIDDPPVVVRFRGRPQPLANPLLLLRGDNAQAETVTIFRGRGHGDLHPGNIMVPVVRGEAAAERFRLIDIGRFSMATPISRDPVKLLLSVAEQWVSRVNPPAVRSRIAEIVVDPLECGVTPATSGYVDVARQVFEAAATWAADRRLVGPWERQHRLVLGASALRTVSRADVAEDLRWWHLEVAALALAPFLPSPDGRRPAGTGRPAAVVPLVSSDSPDDDLHRLASILREALLSRDDRKLVVLVGAGVTGARVPPVARLTTWAVDFADQERLTRPRNDPNEPRPVNPGMQQAVMAKYVEALDFIREVRGTDGLRAFLQQASMQAHSDGRQPPFDGVALPDPDYRRIEDDPTGWRTTEGLTLLADLLRRHGRNVHPVLLTTNFDPLLEVTLRQAGLDIATGHAVGGPDHSMRPLRSGVDRWTVVHLHGTPHGSSLHHPSVIDQPHPQVEEWLASLLRGNRLLVLGYSGWDGLLQRTLRNHFGRGGEEKSDQGTEILWAVYEPQQEHPNINPALSEFFAQYDQRGVIPFYGVSDDSLIRILGEELNGRQTLVRENFYTTVRRLSQHHKFAHSHIRPDMTPAFVFWPHRLRDPHVIHGVHALTAALLSKRNVPIELHLDDTDMTDRYADEHAEEFTDAVYGWFERCGAHEPPRIFRIRQLLSSIPEPELSARLWHLATDLFSRENPVLDALLATKVIKADRGATTVDPTWANRMLRPLYTWLALDHALERHRRRDRPDRPVVTLGGIDEQKMWDLWRARSGVAPVASIFVPRLETLTNVWDMSELRRYGTYGPQDLERLLVQSASSGRAGTPLLEWTFNVANRLADYASDGAVPAMRNPDDTPMSWEAFLARVRQIPEETCRNLAETIAAWLYHDAADIR